MEMTVTESVFENGGIVLFFIFILIADKKFHWFEEVECDDVAAFNLRRKR